MDRSNNNIRTVISIAVGLWLAFAFIGPGYEVLKNNPVPRLGLVFSIINEGSLHIDEYANFSPDKAFFAGHYYSDKAPGLSLMAVPFVAPLIAAAKALGVDSAPLRDGQFTDFALLAGYLASIATSGIAVALAAAAAFLLAQHFGLTRQAALVGSLGYGLATPAFGWATMFVGHAMTGACLFLGFTLTAICDPDSTPPRRRVLLGAAIGGLLTWACVVEYTTGLSAIVVGLFGLNRLLRCHRAAAGHVLAGVAAGTAAALLPLLVYNQLAFGNPLSIGYEYVVGFDTMKQGTMGFALPRLWVAWQLLFGTYRGLFWLALVLCVLPLAWRAAWRRLPHDFVAVLVIIPLLTLVVNAGYFEWAGGASTGPRHLVPALAFAGFALAPLWDSLRSPAARGTLFALLALSAVLSVICASVTMGAPNPLSDGLLAYMLRHFAAGDIHNALDFALRRIPGWRQAGPVHLVTLLVLPLLWVLALGLARLIAPRLPPSVATR